MKARRSWTDFSRSKGQLDLPSKSFAFPISMSQVSTLPKCEGHRISETQTTADHEKRHAERYFARSWFAKCSSLSVAKHKLSTQKRHTRAALPETSFETPCDQLRTKILYRSRPVNKGAHIQPTLTLESRSCKARQSMSNSEQQIIYGNIGCNKPFS